MKIDLFAKPVHGNTGVNLTVSEEVSAKSVRKTAFVSAFEATVETVLLGTTAHSKMLHKGFGR